ncbi:uncharacterized protein LOC131604764 [Vicia villosa]|uniref:uncharacterized protein LOC131604764 n=1 Tax=Vicia villosa TaxID=3911 RepID=UPI00273B8F9C|nr:uncharacterized protein LOC131604764 [Vicia villosa]
MDARYLFLETCYNPIPTTNVKKTNQQTGKSFASIVSNNVCDIPLSQLSAPCLKVTIEANKADHINIIDHEGIVKIRETNGSSEVECVYATQIEEQNDFNAIISNDEYKGSHTPTRTPMNDFFNWFITNHYILLPTIGNKYTWNNGRKGRQLSEERLDIVDVKTIENMSFGDVISWDKLLDWIFSHYNANTIVPITKTNDAKSLNHFRPISLANFMRKIVTKIIIDRLPTILSFLISLKQKWFVTGRNIRDNICLTYEAINLLNNKSFGGNGALKIDIYKSFDTLI